MGFDGLVDGWQLIAWQLALALADNVTAYSSLMWYD
jgi:hypothetical protein